MATTVQTTARAKPVGDDAQFRAGRAVCTTSRWIYGNGQWQDVRCQEQLIARGDVVLFCALRKVYLRNFRRQEKARR